MKGMTVSSCCCCSLRIGCTILGVIYVLGGLFNLSQALSANGFWADWLNALGLPIGALILAGIYMNKPEFLLPFLFYTPITILCMFFKIDDNLDIRQHEAGFDRPKEATILYVAVAIASVFQIFLAVCVYSLYKSMKEGSQPREISNA